MQYKKRNKVKPKNPAATENSGIKIMTTKQIENLTTMVEAIEKHARIEVLKKVRTKLEDKANSLDRILESKEAWNIIENSMGYNYEKLSEKRRTLKTKYYTTWDIISKINEEILEEYSK